jgi:DNA gyrase subunit A
MDPRDGLKDDGYQLSEAQALEILAMRLHRLTGLEQEKLSDEYKQILETIRGLIEILENPERLLEVIRGELERSRPSSAMRVAPRSSIRRKISTCST